MRVLSLVDAGFQPNLEAHKGNLHVLTTALIELIVSVRSVSGATDERAIGDSLQMFVDVTATFLLRMARAPPEKGRVSAAHYWIFLDMFVRQAPFLTRDKVEAMVPYCLLRSQYRALYAAGQEEKEADVALGAPQ